MQRSRAVSRQYLLEVLFYMDLMYFMGNIQVCIYNINIHVQSNESISVIFDF